MAEARGAQRAYRAPCPGCGAPVEFRSAQSAFAVCAYCRSTVARQGEQLARIGRMAELFEDFSPLQLFATGRVLDQPFTLVGRLQYSYAGGRWTEWIAALGEGEGERTGILSEDNGAFVFSLPLALKQPAPPAKHLRVGASTAIDGQRYAIASSEQASLVSAQGELPKLPELGRPFTVVELRNDRGEVLSLEYTGGEPTASLGRSVQLKDLQLAGLRDESARSEQGRSFGCPHCGAPVTVNFDQSRSIACGNCHSLIDLTQGIGGELRHAEQDEPVRPLIALGALGTLQGVAWQVVGFQHRMGTEPGDDERFGWSEYLLFNRERGFAFLVDAEDGWSLVRPTTGAPTLAGGQATQATYLGKTYEQQYAYHAETTYAAGEFYWKVERGQRTFNRDFAAGGSLLSMERSAQEVTWSAGTRIESATVAAAFKLEAKKEMFKRSDAAPLSAASGLGCGTIVLIVVVVVIVLILLSTCSGSSGGGSRSSGGSYGGYSSGGGHK